MNRRDFIRNAASGLFVLKAAPIVFDLGANIYRGRTLDVAIEIVPGKPVIISSKGLNAIVKFPQLAWSQRINGREVENITMYLGKRIEWTELSGRKNIFYIPGEV